MRCFFVCLKFIRGVSTGILTIIWLALYLDSHAWHLIAYVTHIISNWTLGTTVARLPHFLNSEIYHHWCCTCIWIHGLFFQIWNLQTAEEICSQSGFSEFLLNLRKHVDFTSCLWNVEYSKCHGKLVRHKVEKKWASLALFFFHIWAKLFLFSISPCKVYPLQICAQEETSCATNGPNSQVCPSGG